MEKHSTDNTIPLVVDLDGTLINTDLLYESILALLKKNPLYIFLLLSWVLKGKLYFKNKIAGIAPINPMLLPYNEALLDFLKKETETGRRVVLATASPLSYASEIAKIHPLFNQVYGTDTVNLKGKNKLQALLRVFGEKKFDYIGNSYSDLIIFASCRFSYLNNASGLLKKRTEKVSDLQFTWKSEKGWKYLLKAIRPYQWLKNLLLFVPLITAHKFSSFDLIVQLLYAFIAFNFVASSGYLANDLLDLNSDRAHPRKRFRPLASGKVSILTGVVSAFILFTCGLYLAFSLNHIFFIILLSYFITTLAYSFYFKKAVLYDVFILALLYSIRVIAGGEIINVQLSFWLISFSTFIFLSLAFVKRFSELMHITDKKGLKNRGRGYLPEDLSLLKIMGIISGFISVVVFSLYIDSPEVAIIYTKPKMLWPIGLLFLFWITHIWLITTRGKMTDDPIIFTLKDFTSYFIFLLIGIIIIISI